MGVNALKFAFGVTFCHNMGTYYISMVAPLEKLNSRGAGAEVLPGEARPVGVERGALLIEREAQAVLPEDAHEGIDQIREQLDSGVNIPDAGGSIPNPDAQLVAKVFQTPAAQDQFMKASPTDRVMLLLHARNLDAWAAVGLLEQQSRS